VSAPLLIAVVAALTTAGDAGQAAWKTFANPKLGLELQYPASWSVESATSDYVEVSPPSHRMALSFDHFQPPADGEYKDFDRWTRKTFAALLGGDKPREKARLKVGALPVFTWKVERPRSGGKTVIEMQAWYGVPYAEPHSQGGRIYVLLGEVDKRDPDAPEIERVFDAMVRSVRMRPLAE
jgi:hypothetical protein